MDAMKVRQAIDPRGLQDGQAGAARGGQRVHDLFPRKWVNGQSLPGPLLVQLGGVEAATVHPRPGVEERAHVLRFEPIDHVTRKTILLPGHERTPAGYGLVLTRRLAEQIAAAVGTDVLDDWKGQLVVFEPTTLNGKRVLAARKPKIAAQTQANQRDTHARDHNEAMANGHSR